MLVDFTCERGIRKKCRRISDQLEHAEYKGSFLLQAPWAQLSTQVNMTRAKM